MNKIYMQFQVKDLETIINKNYHKIYKPHLNGMIHKNKYIKENLINTILKKEPDIFQYDRGRFKKIACKQDVNTYK